jgi:hypothetical protein
MAKVYLSGFYGHKEAAPVSDLKVTKERVVAAAAKCGDAARVLKELFPDAFASTELGGSLTVGTDVVVSKSYALNFQEKAFTLSPAFEWTLQQNSGRQLLFLTPKA